MNIIMAGIDYHCASIEVREKVGFNPKEVRNLIKIMKEKNLINGVVMISTCNRMEVYFSYNNCEKIDPINIICKATGLKENEMKKYFYIKKGDEASIYLFELACGIHSMIFGEDQIITQVKDAIFLANEEMTSDANLNTLFRYAVTCAKRVKTELVLSSVSPSVASQAIQFIGSYFESDYTRRALVIGNGVIGRKVCEELIKKNCVVTMTLRNHHTNLNYNIPKGCNTIEYNERESLLEQIDILISATSSPHQTITYDMIENKNTKPRYIIDLAVPRDIDPKINDIKDIIFCNVDTLGESARKDNSKEIEAMKILIEYYLNKYKKWNLHRKRICLNTELNRKVL